MGRRFDPDGAHPDKFTAEKDPKCVQKPPVKSARKPPGLAVVNISKKRLLALPNPIFAPADYQ